MRDHVFNNMQDSFVRVDNLPRYDLAAYGGEIPPDAVCVVAHTVAAYEKQKRKYVNLNLLWVGVVYDAPLVLASEAGSGADEE
jgi:hypothetical protein